MGLTRTRAGERGVKGRREKSPQGRWWKQGTEVFALTGIWGTQR